MEAFGSPMLAQAIIPPFIPISGLAEQVRLSKRVEPVRNTRNIGKADMVYNDKLPKIEVDPETYMVKADGELLTCEPATELPLAQRYFLF